MNNKQNKSLKNLQEIAKKRVSGIDIEELRKKASVAGERITEKAGEIKETAIIVKDDINDKLTELDRMLDAEVTNYNDAYTLMNDKGVKLFVERNRDSDLIDYVENLINSIANHPAEFDAEISEIDTKRKTFNDSCVYAERELKAAREASVTAGAGLAAGASVAFMAPTAAMWVATTFGTASTGVAISTLSGAAAESAALAWLGGGALSIGGGGMAAGNALLALAGPVGWTIAGATLLSTIIIFAKKRAKLNKEKNEEIEAVKKNTELIKEMDAKINSILNETTSIREALSSVYKECLIMFGKDYSEFSVGQKMKLGTLLNETKALSAMFDKTIS